MSGFLCKLAIFVHVENEKNQYWPKLTSTFDKVLSLCSPMSMVFERNKLTISIVVKISLLINILIVLSTIAFAEVTKSQSSHLEKINFEDSTLRQYSDIYHFISGLPDHELSKRLTEIWNVAQKRMTPQDRYTLEIAILQRLSSVNPSEALRLAEAYEDDAWAPLIPTVFEVWAIEDLESAIDLARNLDFYSRQDAWEGIVSSKSTWEPANLQRLAAQLEIDVEEFIESLASLIDVEQVGDAKKAWHVFAELAREVDERVSNELLGPLAIQWFNKEGFDALDEIRDQRDLSPDLRERVLRSVLLHLGRESPRLALDYLLALPNTYAWIAGSLIGQWARVDLPAAIEFADTVPQSDLRETMQQRVASEWAQQDPLDLLRNLTVFPVHVRWAAAPDAIRAIAEYSLEEAGAEALQLGDPRLRNVTVAMLLEIWAEQEPSTLLDWWLHAPAYEAIDDWVRQRLVWTTVDIDPRRAFALALKHPIAEQEQGFFSAAGLEAATLEEIAGSDVDLALELLPECREGQTKLTATYHVGNELMYRGDLEQALDLAQQLPVSSREIYFNRIIANWRNLDPIGLLEAIDEFPTAPLRSRVAYFLLQWDRWHSLLDSAQVETLQKLLNRIDRDYLRY